MYVLIMASVLFWGVDDKLPIIQTAEFNNQKACQAAADYINTAIAGTAKCFPKD